MSQFIEMFGNPFEINSEMVPLSSLCSINPFKPKGLDDSLSVSFIPMDRISEDGEYAEFETKPLKDVKKGFTYCAEDDVLFAKITPCMENGKGAILKGLSNGIGFCSTEFHVLRPIWGISNSEWLYFLTKLNGFRIDAAKNMIGTGGQKRVPSSYLLNFKVLKPQLEAQKEFAKIVHQADKSKFGDFKSQFIEMFGGLCQDTPWSDVVTITNGKAYPEEYQEEGAYPICGSGGIMCYGEKKLCNGNTTILGRKGNINNPIFMESGYWIVDTAFSIDVDKAKLHPKFFYYWCCQYDLTKLNKQGILPSLTRKDLEKVKMAIPQMRDQLKFVSIAEQADKSKSVIQKALVYLNDIQSDELGKIA